MGVREFFKWGTSSLAGNVALAQLCFSLPLLMYFIPEIYLQGELTLSWVIYMVFLTIVIGTIVGALIWYSVTAPIVKSRDKK